MHAYFLREREKATKEFFVRYKENEGVKKKTKERKRERERERQLSSQVRHRNNQLYRSTDMGAL